jgi:uncharacterized membrane protein
VVLKTLELISIVLAAFVGGMFWGPWLALSRSMKTFAPDVFLAVVHRMSPNMASVMTAMMPIGLLSMLPVLALSYGGRPATFYLTLGAFALFAGALLVTLIIEVPIVKQIETWTVSTFPENWRRLRDRWGAFHLVRVATAGAGLLLLTAAAIYP